VTPTQSVLALVWALASLGTALWVVHGAIAYARRHGMLDQPGQRRSHRLPTPRGGGIGLVVATLLTLPPALITLPVGPPLLLVACLELALALVAMIGWVDDHRSLGIVPRLGVQLLAATLFSIALLAHSHAWLWLPVLVLSAGWSINLHNFMDGIDGLLAQQLVFVATGLGLLAASVTLPALAAASLAVAAAGLGFWYYNRSPARIFMGDVGSGAAGFLLFALAAMLWWKQRELLWPALILCSGFVTDASLTLLSRFVRGRRWYSAHREHLYQWLVRSGYSHARCAALYLGWNLLVAAPATILAKVSPALALPACVGVYTVAVATWNVTKRRCLRRNLREARHVGT
jgi:UDP-N-acetylmuramyl pentapeptide phosphotransferase/UDP-N-acetylglucosamine-1-phosphate transferase